MTEKNSLPKKVNKINNDPRAPSITTIKGPGTGYVPLVF